MSDKISASEALFGFMGWLTTRDETLMIGAQHECSPVADVVKEFCDANSLEEPRDNWHHHFVHPKEKRDDLT
ncbi:hypothetical protein LCGC14_2108630 [marine sediment metagenome]|uniref:Uncharacterized protein n=1 Tax=marine sediment metagenome TaxID=412755 RepID=A0A0F9E7T9_9ZZZZ